MRRAKTYDNTFNRLGREKETPKSDCQSHIAHRWTDQLHARPFGPLAICKDPAFSTQARRHQGPLAFYEMRAEKVNDYCPGGVCFGVADAGNVDDIAHMQRLRACSDATAAYRKKVAGQRRGKFLNHCARSGINRHGSLVFAGNNALVAAGNQH